MSLYRKQWLWICLRIPLVLFLVHLADLLLKMFPTHKQAGLSEGRDARGYGVYGGSCNDVMNGELKHDVNSVISCI
jgi:hypothetical protein